MAESTSVSLFGVIHFTSHHPVRRELTSFAEDADAIFVEQARREVTRGEFLQAFLRNPLGLLGALLWFVGIHAPCMLAFNGDLRATELVVLDRVAERLAVPVHAVDQNIFTNLTHRGIGTTVLNWAILGPFAILFPLSTAVTVGLLLAGIVPYAIRSRDHRIASMLAVVGWFVAALALLFAGQFTPYGLSVPLILILLVVGQAEMIRSVAERNRVMLDRVEAVSAEEGYDDVVHVTGKAHLGGMVKRGRDRGLEVPRAHVSAWRDFGETVHDPVPGAVPSAGDVGRRGPILARGSERTVLRRRLVSGAQDGVLVGLIGVLATCLLLLSVTSLFDPDITPLTALLTIATGFFAVPLFLLVQQEWAQATTGNKATSDLVVADAEDGTAPTFRAVCLRNLVKPIDALGIGLVAVYLTERNQRLGDLLAGTVVGEDAAATSTASDAAGADASDGGTEGAESVEEDRPRVQPSAADAE